MSTQQQSQFFESSSSRWLANQAASSANMIEKMVREELRRGDFSKMHERVTRIEELVNEHVLETARERELLLLAAVLLEGGGETRGAYRLSGKLLADKERLEHAFLSSLRRFRVRLALNCGDIKEARAEVALTERVVMETLRGLGEISETIDQEDLSHVTAATWLVSAEVSLAEGELDQALQDLANARSCMTVSGCLVPDESASFELLSALACVSLNDVGGAAALAHLYNSHVILRSESSVEALTSARISAAAGDMARTTGISEAEALRWRGYGPEPNVVQHYLREGSSVPAVPVAAMVEDKLPLPHELIAALDQSLIDVNVNDAVVQHSTEVSNPDLLPMSFLFEYFRLEEVTGMFDYNLKTGHLTVDWSRCDSSLLREAVDVGAISEFVLRCKRGTIYLNGGSYVDAVLDSSEDQLRNMSATDVIFELFRISTACLPGVGARQFQGGPEAKRLPEVINLRPNKFNLDLTRRLDDMRCGKRAVEVESDELDFDAAFASWESSGAEKVVDERAGDRAEQFVRVSAGGELSSLLPVLSCEDVVSLELSVVECLASIGVGQSRIEIVATDSSERLRECGLSAELCDTWGTYAVGRLSLVLGLGKNIRVDSSESVDVIMKAAAQRLKTLPGTKLIGKMDVSGFIAEDPAMQNVLSQLREIAMLDGCEKSRMSHVILSGERGSGKELLAHLIHDWSRRNGGTFQVANLGAIAKDLAPAEIFGSKKGSYTGAIADRIGYIQKAEGGTLFLDELDEADETTQALLKRVVQFSTYNVVGCPDESSCNVRFVAATNRGLDEDGCIKPDLKDRFWIVRIPPLRERRADIPALAQFFANQHNYRLPEPVLAYLTDLQWPGNVRQLETVVERVCAVVKSADEVNLAAFEHAVRESGTNPVIFDFGNEFTPLGVGETLKDRQDALDRWHISYMLKLTNWHKTEAARLLGMRRQTMTERMKALGMSLEKPRA